MKRPMDYLKKNPKPEEWLPFNTSLSLVQIDLNWKFKRTREENKDGFEHTTYKLLIKNI